MMHRCRQLDRQERVTDHTIMEGKARLSRKNACCSERGACVWRADSHCQPAGRGLLFRLKYFMCIITVHPHSRLLG